MDWEKSFIEWVKQNQLLLRSFWRSSETSNLYQAPVALHSEEIHFVKEIIQKLDGHTYGEDVCPCLEFYLTTEDVAEVDASATLLVLNNDVGLTAAIITALCNFATSSTIGTWLKSAFTVCETPIIISKGFRIRFRNETCKETAVGCIVPEWAVSPTDDKVLSTIGHEKLPANVIILPICDDKVDLIRNQLADLCPEVLLFLSNIRELEVEDVAYGLVPRKHLRLCVTRSNPLSGVVGRDCKFSKVTLTVEWPSLVDEGEYSYLIFQQRFPVMPSVQERQEIQDWVITLAFPQRERASLSPDSSEVFSIVQTGLKTGFPFLISANFIFTRPTEIQLSNEWNTGILNCVPMAFQIAFEIMLQKRESKLLEADGVTKTWEDKSRNAFHRLSAYQFLPCNKIEKARFFPSNNGDELRPIRRKLDVQPHHAPNEHQLEKVRYEILQRLGTDSKILLSTANIGSPLKYTDGYEESNWFSAKACVKVKSTFRSILRDAASINHPAPLVVLDKPDGATSPTAKFVLARFAAQMNYPSVLSALGVPDMMSAQYESFLMDAHWLVKLPDKIYVRLLSFFAFEMILLNEGESRYSYVRETFRILKVRGQTSPVELATFSEVSLSLGTELLYTCSEDDAQWIWEWVNEFSLCDSAKFMPAETSKALVEANDSAKLMAWVKKHRSLKEVSAENYADRLIEKLQIITCN